MTGEGECGGDMTGEGDCRGDMTGEGECVGRHDWCRGGWERHGW